MKDNGLFCLLYAMNVLNLEPLDQELAFLREENITLKEKSLILPLLMVNLLKECISYEHPALKNEVNKLFYSKSTRSLVRKRTRAKQSKK